MPVTFKEGQALPAPGTDAYKAAQQGSGMANFNPSTGSISVGGAPAATGAKAPSAPSLSTPNTPSAIPNMQVTVGGKQYDLSSASGLKSYQDVISKVQPQNSGTSPAVGSPSLQGTQNAPINVPNNTVSSPLQDVNAIANKFQDLYKGGVPNKIDVSDPASARQGVQEATNSWSSAQNANNPPQPVASPAFQQFGDPILQNYTKLALDSLDQINTQGQMVNAMKATFQEQLGSMDVEAMNIQNTMDGTADSIRQEVTKAGGFATESQIQGLATARNKDLIKQYNSLQIQKTAMSNQMQAQIGLAQTDLQYAQGKYDMATNAVSMYDAMNKATDTKMQKILTDYGPQQVSEMYKNDPYTLQLMGQRLYGDPNALLDPARVASMQTYHDKQLELSASRLQLSAQGQGNLMDYRQSMEAQRYTSAGNSIVKNYMSMPAYKIYANASPYLARIEAAASVPGSVSDNDILDSLIKLTTGGGQITEAQVATITGARSFADSANVLSKKISAQGGVLSDDQRKQAINLAQKVYAQYQKGYTPIRDAMYKAFDTSKIPQQYRDIIPDLNALSLVGGAASTYGTNSSGGTVNGAHYYLASDGNYYPDNTQ